MELLSLVQDGLQSVVEHGVSYRLGQSVLRQADRALWVVEKCARWAVPPPLDQDDRPQPELVRPLPWVFFLMLLVTLRVTREGISIVYLAFGKPPLRSADVVIYIQSKRRYLRMLKYQGNRLMRARTSASAAGGGVTAGGWGQSLQALLQYIMCFRTPQYYNNNSLTHDDVAIVKLNKRGRETEPAVPAQNETTMERLIEKIMVDLDGDSDEDASYTLTNATSIRSDQSEITVDSEDDSLINNNQSSTPKKVPPPTPESNDLGNTVSPSHSKQSTPDKKANGDEKPLQNGNENQVDKGIKQDESPKKNYEPKYTAPKKIPAPKVESQNFIQNESQNQRKYQQGQKKIANGRTAKVSPVSKKETLGQMQGADVPVVKLTNESLNGGKENSRPTNLYK